MSALRTFACAALCAGLLAAAPAGASAAQSYGFNDLSWGSPYISHATAKSEFAKAHARYWRLPVSMQYFWPKQDTMDQGYFSWVYDAYNQMLANGQTPVFIVMGSPYWALTSAGKGAAKGSLYCADNNNATICNAPPDVRNAQIASSWQMFVQLLAYFMPKAVYEIWNEPNIDWSWMQPQDPELYGLLLKSASTAIHAISPTTTVISGSVSSYSGANTTANTDYRSFLQSIYSVAGKDSFNAIGFHTYPCNTTPTPAGWTSMPNTVLSAVRTVRNANGDSSKPLWLTETGASTGPAAAGNCTTGFTETQQASALGAVLNWAKQQDNSKHDLPVVLVHSLFNFQPRATSNFSPSWLYASSENEFGLISYTLGGTNNATVTYKAKPALATVTCKFAGTC